MNKNWNSYRIKDIAKVSRGGSPRPIQNYLTDDEVNGIPWIKISDATKVKKYIESTEQYIIQSGVGKSNIVLPGDLIVSNSATPGIPRFLKIKACIHDGWLLLRKLKNIKKEFLFYLIESIRSKLKNQGTGSIFINLSIDILANEIVFIPTFQQQEKIANYLDIETSKIDRKISILEQKFDKLEEYKQSVIFETVTKGLDSNVVIKNSGIDWIGEIPAHWEVKRVKDIFNIGRGRVIAATEVEKEQNQTNKYPVYSAATENNGIIGYINTFDFDKPLLTWTTDGAKAGTVFIRNGEFNCTNVCGTLILNSPNYELNFLKYCLQTQTPYYKRPDTNGAKIMNNEMAGILLVLPSGLEEQQEIANYLDNFTLTIERKKEIIQKQIQLLQEYKQSVIFEAVTGKIEIL